MSGLARSFIVVAGLLLTAAGARAQIFSWTNSAGGTFGTSTNWSPAGPPSTSAHTAVFNLSGVSYNVSLGASHTIGTLNVGSSQFTQNINMLGRTLSVVSRMNFDSDVNITGGGTFGGSQSVTTLRESSLNVGTGSFFRTGSLTIGSTGFFASAVSFTSSTFSSLGTAVGSETVGFLTMSNGAVGTSTFLNAGPTGQLAGGAVDLFSNSTLNVGTINLGVQGDLANNSRISVVGGSRVTMLPDSPLTIGGSTIEFVFNLPPNPSTFNRGGILRISNAGTIGGTSGTFSTSNAPTLVNYGGLIDIQAGTFTANSNVTSNGFISIATSGNFIASTAQTTVVDAQYAGAPVGSLILGIVPGLECYGRMTAGTLIIGSAIASNGWAVISSPSISLDRALIVGGAGTGRLDVGLMSSPALLIGQTAGSSGVVNVGTYSVGSLGTSTLSSGTLSTTATNTIGSSGDGTLSIGASSLFTTIASTNVGSGGGSDGTLILFGTGTGTMLPARFEAPANRLTVGVNGRGTLLIGGNSSLNVATLLVGPAPLTGVGFGTVLQSGGTVSVGTLLSVNPTGYYAMSGGTILSAVNNSGTFSYTGGVLTQPLSNSGTTIINGPLAAGSVINNNPAGRLLSTTGLIAGNGTINNAGSLGGTGTIAAGMTLHNTGTLGSFGGDFVIENGVTFTNAAGSLIRNAQLSTLRLRTFLDNAGNVEVNAGGGVETAFSLNILTGQTLTLKGGLLSVGNSVVGDNLPIFPGATVVGFGQINASMYNSGSTQFNGPTQIVGLFQNDAAVNVRNATTIVYGPMTNNGSITVNNGTFVTEAAFSLAARGGMSGGITGTGALTIQPGGRLVTDSIHQNEIALTGNLAAPAFAFIRPNAAGGVTSVVKTPTIAGAPGTYQSQLDLADNAMVIDYDGTAPAAIRDYLVSGYANGAWNGMGITSSAAAGLPNRALGFAGSSEIFSSFPAIFAGESVDSTSLLIRYTIYGDANLDRAVNITDFALLAANFNTSALWSKGDFNYDNITNIADFALLAANFNQSLPADVPRQSIPEPASLGILFGIRLVLTRARRRNEWIS